MFRIRSLSAIILAIFLLVLTPACSSNQSPSRFQSAQEQSTQPQATAVAEDAVKGGELNRYFPKTEDNYQIVYTQEKKGFAQAKLKQNGEELALLSISDIASNPSAADKFKSSDETIKNYPVVNQGSKGTALLVNNRYQVKILSRSDNFDESQRKKWLQKFNLDPLAEL